MLLGDVESAGAERRLRCGLAVLPGDAEMREVLATRMYDMLSRGYADSTNKVDDGYWRRWEQFCVKVMGTSPYRTDVAANSGADPDGHQEEVFLCVSALMHFYDQMRPRRRTDPAADPRSAKKVLEGVARRHAVRGIKMVSMQVVNLAVKGMCREYIEMYGVDTLVPERKLPFTDRILASIFRAPEGSTRGGLTLRWKDYHWVAVRACFATLKEEGGRKDEVAKKTAATPFRKGRLTFASLVWHIGGVATIRRSPHLHAPPSREQLRTLREGDGVLLKHGIAKNDPFGAYFAATPSFLAWREGDESCACRALAELELAAQVPLERRKTTPLFGPAPGEEFTHSQLDLALQLLLIAGGCVTEEQLQNYSVHSFRIFAACALLAAGAPRWLIKRMLRWRGDESLEIYARVNNEDWASWTRKMVNVAVDSSIASRLTYMDFSEETRQRFTDVAEAMLSVNAGAARTATGAL